MKNQKAKNLDAKTITEAFASVRNKIDQAATLARRPKQDVTLIAVSKQQQPERIDASLAAGNRVFGENRVQEAKIRWERRKAIYPDLQLHLIGPLQSNKTADAVRLFDFIHTVDRRKIATAIAVEATKQGKQIECFIQVNTGEELQKSGIAPAELENFLAFCRMEAGLSVKGLMCIPPVLEEAAMHFALLKTLSERHGLASLSMGMSGDYEEAIGFGATHVRLGSALFGARI